MPSPPSGPGVTPGSAPPGPGVVAKPAGGDPSYAEDLGSALEALAEEGARAQEERLRAMGLRVDALPRFPMDMTIAPGERPRRGMLLARCNFFGPEGPV